MSFFALTVPGGLSETHDLQESLTALQKFVKTASPVVLSALWHIALALVILVIFYWLGVVASRAVMKRHDQASR